MRWQGIPLPVSCLPSLDAFWVVLVMATILALGHATAAETGRPLTNVVRDSWAGALQSTPSFEDLQALYGRALTRFEGAQIRLAHEDLADILAVPKLSAELRAAALSMQAQCEVLLGQETAAVNHLRELLTVLRVEQGENSARSAAAEGRAAALRLSVHARLSHLAESAGDLRRARGHMEQAWSCWRLIPPELAADERIALRRAAGAVLSHLVRIDFRMRSYDAAAEHADLYLEQFPHAEDRHLMTFRRMVIQALCREPSLRPACDPCSVSGSFQEILRPIPGRLDEQHRTAQRRELDRITAQLEDLLAKPDIPLRYEVFIRYHLAWVHKQWGEAGKALAQFGEILRKERSVSLDRSYAELVERARIEAALLHHSAGDTAKARAVIDPLLGESEPRAHTHEVVRQVLKLLEISRAEQERSSEKEGVGILE